MFYKFLIIIVFYNFHSFTKIVVDGQEKTVVYVDMVADLFHSGHVNMLKNAKKFGDILIVGLMSDEDTASYKRVPILTLEERFAVVSSCKYVDKVIPGSPLKLTSDFISEHGIDIVVHGNDMSTETLAIYYSVPMKMGILRVLPYTEGISTSDIIRRILSRFADSDKIH